MDEAPLLGGPSKGTSTPMKTIIIVVLGLGFVVALAAVIGLAVKLQQKNTSPPHTIPCETISTPVARDSAYDFPLYPADPWDIAQDHSRQFAFDTTEGTWMNLDISPDGNTIIFDMLGDIYTMPITGGVATPLITGVAWDVQPRYSPDGNSILYTSDLSGCENIWVYNLITKEKKQVTFDPYFYTNNAQWINNEIIVANQWHLVGTRSISGGEIWQFTVPPRSLPWGDQRSKNPGVRLVGRSLQDAQVGPEEPYPSQERYIYYSKNTVDRTNWNYNKDPHAGIYAIFKYDNVTKENVEITGGPGGAARPILSPDGTKLAFIKRTLFKTSLMIHEIETGNDFWLMDLQYQDQQESFAPAGVFPRFSFHPDGSRIIVWRAGKIISVPAIGGTPEEIPFRVSVQLDLAKTVRYPHPVSNTTDSSFFNTKIALNPKLSPSKNLIVFSALGEIWVHNIQSNSKAKLSEEPNTTNNFWPSVSHDDQFVVRTGWTDEGFGYVEAVNLQTGAKSLITNLPGRYLKPSYSPAMDAVVYSKTSGDSQSGYRYSLNPGIYICRINANSEPIVGKSTYFISEGLYAYWAHSNSVLHVIGEQTYPLVVDQIVINSDTDLKKTPLASSLYANDMAFSQDNKLVAFVEFEVLYVQRFVPSNNNTYVEITARHDVLYGNPRTQIISKMGAGSLSWNGQVLSFGWASNFTVIDLSEMASPSWSCKDQHCFGSGSNSYSLSITAHTAVLQETHIVFDNVNIISMEPGSSPIESNQKIIVKGDTIVAMGNRDEIPNPDDAQVVDVAGGYVLPGFIDAHAHWDSAFATPWGKTVQGWEFLTNLAYGVTTLHNPSTDFYSVFVDAELIKSGKKIGPRVFSTAWPIYGAGGADHCEIGSLQDAVYMLLRRKALGSWSVKSYQQSCRSARQKILAAARQLKMNVVPEGGMQFQWDLSFIVDGHTTVEHTLPMAPFYHDVLSLFGTAGTAWTPTLVVAFGGLHGDRHNYQVDNVWQEPLVKTWIPDAVVQPVSMRRLKADDRDYHVFTIAKAAADVSRYGGLVNVGAHGQMQGVGFLWELRLFESGNMTDGLYDVYKTATINPARSLGLDSQIGSIQVGKLADLLFFGPQDNPLASVEAVSNIMWVMKDGRVHNPKTGAQVYPWPAPAPKLTPINIPNL